MTTEELKQRLLIESPSLVFYEIMKEAAECFWRGYEDGLRESEKQIKRRAAHVRRWRRK